ncbi:prepilin peptidase [Candidatus Korarchaeum cryptofilum]|jgi:hypothetical protein|uniref:Peptidase A24A prepilin type IV n=1 Tax=Korarchaeum cryptofilum (strain OPF8) TaxID=374847 RepID=B1L3X1_KORCO|nr:prepilin peptidase [Candidatus Korarchaeum cryptofilum]ACB07150.1 peptidase A24A prepilin type IV [Candidatus Korarchaeum cryptofilum OPF8]
MMLPLILAIITLLIASLYDLKDRQVPDELWVPGVAVGLSIKVLEWERTVKFLENYWPFLLLLAIMLLIEWFLSTSGEADLLAYLTLASLMSGKCWFPDALIIYIASKVLMVLTLPFQFLLNLITVMRHPELIEGFDEPIWRKLLALLLLTPYRRPLSFYATVAEIEVGGKRKFVLRAALKPISDEMPEEGKWIAPTYPMIPFILAATIITALC